LPEHCVWPGAQTPPQDAVPLLIRHVVFEQVEGVPQAPEAEHVDTALRGLPPESIAHSVAPGVHTPAHSAAVPASSLIVTQAWLAHAIGVPQ
jgi:hypothetical protein